MNYICIAESLHNCLAESASHKPPGWQQAVSRSWTHQNHPRTTSNFEFFFVVHPYSSTKTRDVTWYNLLRTPGMNHHLQAPTIPHLQCHHHRTATRNHDATLETNREVRRPKWLRCTWQIMATPKWLATIRQTIVNHQIWRYTFSDTPSFSQPLCHKKNRTYECMFATCYNQNGDSQSFTSF